MSGSIEIFVRDVSDVEAHLFAQFIPPPNSSETKLDVSVALRGTVRGPYCERAHTLPAEFRFRDLAPQRQGLAEAIVPDPCTWTPELPHLYQVDIEAAQYDRVIAAYHGMIGLRRAGQPQVFEATS